MQRILNFLLVLSSFVGYLEWGGGNSQFLITTEGEVLRRIVTDPLSVLHPFVVLPMLGQLFLLLSIRKIKPNRWLTYFGIAFIGVLMIMLLVVGIMGANWKVGTSALPFIILASIVIYSRNKKSSNHEESFLADDEFL